MKNTHNQTNRYANLEVSYFIGEGMHPVSGFIGEGMHPVSGFTANDDLW